MKSEDTNMSPLQFPEGYQEALQFPLFSAFMGRRSRRFSMGATIPAGPLAFTSRQEPVPLSQLERDVILGAVAGNTGWHFMIPWNEATAPDLPRFSASAGGRTFPSAAGWHTTDFFFTDDTGVYFLSTRDAHPAESTSRAANSGPERATEAKRAGLQLLHEGRLHLPPESPHVSPHNRWSFNRPGSLVILPVSDVAQYLLALLLNYIERGICMYDDIHGCAIPGIERFRGTVDVDNPAPLSVAEQEALTGCAAEISMACFSGALALQAMGLGGWIFDGLNTFSLLGASEDPDVPGLGFHFQRESRWSTPNPTGLPQVFEGHCPPHFASMREALQSLLNRKFGSGGPYNSSTKGPWKDSARVRGSAREYPPEVVECVAWIAQYVFDRFGKFPGSAPTMFVRTFLQAHHLDLEFYDTFFQPGAYLETHATHFERWHT
jgi:hypothetical protein